MEDGHPSKEGKDPEFRQALGWLHSGLTLTLGTLTVEKVTRRRISVLIWIEIKLKMALVVIIRF